MNSNPLVLAACMTLAALAAPVGSSAAVEDLPDATPIADLVIPLTEVPPSVDVTLGRAACGGLAPLQTSCTTSFSASSYVLLDVEGTFNGQIQLNLVSAHGGYSLYTLQVVAGEILTASRVGPGLYAGGVTMDASTQGYFGMAGANGGAGTWTVVANYA